MADYIQIQFRDLATAQSELLIAGLIDIGFEGFEEKGNDLIAYIPASEFSESACRELANFYGVIFEPSCIPETNWNAVWESNFQPVIIDDFVAIRADFHESIKNVQHEIVITPKMSFGTGHHATTFMMIRQMGKMDLRQKTVLDFGTGTGILAIMAEKLGASKVIAIDNDEWSIRNAGENIVKNNCSKINLSKAETIPPVLFDIIVANINKHVIVNNMKAMSDALQPMGILLLSGLLLEDEADIVNVARKITLQPGEKTTLDNWLSLRFNH